MAPLPAPRSAFFLFFPPPRLAFGSSAGNNNSPPWPRPRARAGDGRGALLSCGASPRYTLPSSLRWHHRRLRRQRGWGWIVKGSEEKKKMDACHRWSGEAAKMPAGSVGPKPAGGERRVCSPSSCGTWRTGSVAECRLAGAGRMEDDGAGEEEDPQPHAGWSSSSPAWVLPCHRPAAALWVLTRDMGLCLLLWTTAANSMDQAMMCHRCLLLAGPCQQRGTQPG